MKLVNYQEDLVLHIAEIVLQDRPDVELTHELLLDTAAYTLNRLPPRYIVGERGFTRLIADTMFEDESGAKLGNLVELLFLINSAVDVVKKRRSSSAPQDQLVGEGEEDDHIEPHWHNIPYIIGRVIDSEDKRPIPDVKITLLVDGDKVGQAGSGWTNPYTTSGAAQGFFSFLPEPIHSEEHARKFDLKLLFEGKGYEPVTLEQTAKTHGELSARRDFRNDGFINLGATRLVKTDS
jgi:competence protein ComFB